MVKFFKHKDIQSEFSHPNLLSNKLVNLLILLAILVNSMGMCIPTFGSNDASFYSVIAKHIVLSNDWVNLTFAGQDWLDKPHFPFWVTAIFYEIFGFSTFSYILPGFIFNLIGAVYTFKLAKHLYGSSYVARIAVLFYVTTLHLMLSAIDVRAEAFLLGEIMPACYYWLLYEQESGIRIRYLIFGALFTGLAVMTKGIFVLLTISSGILVLFIYNKQLKHLFQLKWLFAIILSFVFILPELIALYLQFDAHPEKLIYGHTHVSGIKFFFWDSQFGRFFNSGPITMHSLHSIAHYFFFCHIISWALLPWTPIFIVALWNIYKTFRTDIAENKLDKYRHVYLLGSFIPTFILFSLTTFQLDHYTNIILPFAAIICANWYYNKATRFSTHLIFYIQIGLAILLVTLVVILSMLLFNGKLFILNLELCLVVLALFGILSRNRMLNKAIVYPVLSICLVFLFATLINGKLYAKYDAGYQIDNFIQNESTKQPIIDYNVGLSTLEFYTDNDYFRLNNLPDLLAQSRPYFMVINISDWEKINNQFNDAKVLDTFIYVNQNKFIKDLFNLHQMENDEVNLLLVNIPLESMPTGEK